MSLHTYPRTSKTPVSRLEKWVSVAGNKIREGRVKHSFNPSEPNVYGKGSGEMINHHVLGSILEVEIKNRQARVQPQELSVLSDSVRKCHIASVLDGTKDDIE